MKQNVFNILYVNSKLFFEAVERTIRIIRTIEIIDKTTTDTEDFVKLLSTTISRTPDRDVWCVVSLSGRLLWHNDH